MSPACLPILFSGPMVRAILEGRKTQTRRVMKLEGYEGGNTYENRDGDLVDVLHYCPYGRPGDLLWVRETWRVSIAGGFYVYRADPRKEEFTKELARHDPSIHWHPSIHMPRRASRLTLRITAVRVQRLQEIADGDVAAEGVNWASTRIGNDHGSPARDAFYHAWNAINAKHAPWESNPWVWAITFERIKA